MPLIVGQKLGETFERVHPVVGYRVEKTKDHEKSKRYSPIWLTGDNYVRKQNEGGYEYLFKYPGSSEHEVLPEWKLSEDINSFERLAIEGKRRAGICQCPGSLAGEGMSNLLFRDRSGGKFLRVAPVRHRTRT